MRSVLGVEIELKINWQGPGVYTSLILANRALNRLERLTRHYQCVKHGVNTVLTSF